MKQEVGRVIHNYFTSLTSMYRMLFEDPIFLLMLLLARLLAMLVAVSFHEWAHAFAAYKLGDPTAKNMGRMSLDPMKHLNGIGVLAFMLFGIGWARPVIVNSSNLKHYRRDDIIISLAGVLMNLVLSFVFYGIYFALAAFGVTSEIVTLIMETVIVMNISFAVFNILPIPPLDGYHVLSSLFIRKNFKVVQFFQRYGFIILLVLVVSGVTGTVIGFVVDGLWSLYFRFFMLFV